MSSADSGQSTHSSTPPNKPPPPIPTAIGAAPAAGEKPALPPHPSKGSTRPKSCVVVRPSQNRTAKNAPAKPAVRRVTYFTLTQLRKWRTDQTRRWLLAETGGKIPFAIGSQIVLPRSKEGEPPFVAGEWLCGLTKETAAAAGIPENITPGLIQSIQNFQKKCAAVSIQRWSRRMLGKLEIRRLQKMQKHRTNVAKELYQTEETYLEQLNIMCTLLYRPLTSDKKFQNVLTPDEVRTIFSDIEVISAVNSSLRDTLKERIQNWNNWTKIGDLFIRMSDYLRVYVDYVKGYSQALELVSGMSESHPFRKFFRDQIKLAPPMYANFNFESLLIVPIQRIPRYKMLLMDMLKNMPEDHPDHSDLEEALKKVGEIADWVNENQRKAERMAKSLQLSERVVGMDEQLISASREFILEGLVMEVQALNPQPRTLLLFSDILVVCEVKKADTGSLLKKKKDKMQFLQKFRLCEVKVEESAPCAGFEHCFRVFKEGEDGIVYSALNDDSRAEWVRTMGDAIKDATEKQKKKDEELNKVATAKASQAAAILQQQYASIRFAGGARSRHHGRGDSTVGSATATGTEGSETASDASSNNACGRSSHSRLSSMSSTTSSSRKRETWYSMNAAEKWRIVEDAKAELENLRNLSAIEEALQKQRAIAQAERNKALLHSKYGKYASVNLGGEGGSGPVAQQFTFGNRRSLVGPSGNEPEKRRSMIVASDSGSASGSNDFDDDVVFDDASSYAPSVASSSSSSLQPVVISAAPSSSSSPDATDDS